MTKANDNMTKADIIEKLDQIGYDVNAKTRRMKKPDLASLLAEWEANEAEDIPEEMDDDIEEEISGSRVPNKYRTRYAERAAEAGRKAHTVTGKATLNNGDEFALLWEAIDPAEACNLADAVIPLPDGQTHAAKYAHLNVGMRRMNAGNRIRGAIKRDAVKPDVVRELTQAIIDSRPAA